MLLSTPKSIPIASNVILKRSARKFFDLAQSQGWIVKASVDERRDSTTIEAWDWNGATDPTGETQLTVRVFGWFNADSGAYEGHAFGARSLGYANGARNVRWVAPESSYGEKLGDALNKLERGPKWRAEQAVLKAKKQAEASARKLRQEAMQASVLARGDTELGTTVRNQLAKLMKVSATIDLTNVADHRIDERIAEWRRSKRIAKHATEAKKLIHTFAGTGDQETFLTPEQAVALYADKVQEELIEQLSRSWGSLSLNDAKADGEFIEKFHPRHASAMSSVPIIT